MLDIDSSAAKAIDELTTATGVGPRGGLRITFSPGTPDHGFTLSVEPHPAPEDVVVADGDIRVFLDASAADALADKVLDVRKRHAGRFHFGVYPQA